MKAKKALKRLTSIETLMSDLTDRYSTASPHIRGVLQNAKAAVAQAMEAVNLQVVAKADRAEKKAPPARKKAVVKKATSRATIAKSAKKHASMKKAARERAATMMPSAAVHTATEPAASSTDIAEIERETETGFFANA